MMPTTTTTTQLVHVDHATYSLLFINIVPIPRTSLSLMQIPSLLGPLWCTSCCYCEEPSEVREHIFTHCAHYMTIRTRWLQIGQQLTSRQPDVGPTNTRTNWTSIFWLGFYRMLSSCGTNINKALHGVLDSIISHRCTYYNSLLRCRAPFGRSDGTFLTLFSVLFWDGPLGWDLIFKT